MKTKEKNKRREIKMGRRKRRHRKTSLENDLKVDAEFKLNDELTELLQDVKIANKFLIDNSTQKKMTKHTQTKKIHLLINV